MICIDGCVTLSIPNQDGLEIKYQLLNPSPHFKDLVECTRSVVLAGGTMSPVCFLLFSFLE